MRDFLIVGIIIRKSLAALGEQFAGHGLPLLKEIQGRSADFEIGAEGTIMYGLALIYVVRDLPKVQPFKIVPKSKQLIWVMLAIRADANRKVLSDVVTNGFRKRLSEELRVEVEFPVSLSAKRSEKFRYVISHVTQPIDNSNNA